MQITTDQDTETLKILVKELSKLSKQDKLALIQFTASECDNQMRVKALHLSANKDLSHLRKAQMLMRQLSEQGKITLIRLCAKFLNDGGT